MDVFLTQSVDSSIVAEWHFRHASISSSITRQGYISTKFWSAQDEDRALGRMWVKFCISCQNIDHFPNNKLLVGCYVFIFCVVVFVVVLFSVP